MKHMKKVTLTTAISIILSLFYANGQLTDPLIVTNFDGTNVLPSFFYGTSPNFCTINRIADPDNGSNNILEFNRASTASTWHGPQWNNSVMTAGVSIGSNSSTQYRYLVVKAKKSTSFKISAALQTGVSSAPNITFESSNAYTIGSWVNYVFDLGSANGTYKLLYVMPENGGSASAVTTYLDDIYFTNNISSLVSSSAITGYTGWTPTAYGRAGKSVSLFWPSVTTATSYNVYDGSTMLATGITNPYVTLTGLSSNTTYNIQISGTNSNGESLKSTALVVKTRTKAGVNYEVIDEMEGSNPGWAVMSNATLTYGATNPSQTSPNTSTKAIKVAFSNTNNNYAGAQINIERITTGTQANYRYLHVKILRPTTAPETSGVKLKMIQGGNTLGQTSLVEQEIPLVAGSVIKRDGTWQDYVFDLKAAGVNNQIYKGFFIMPLNTTTAQVGVTADCYIDDVFLSNDATLSSSNLSFRQINLSANESQWGTVSESGEFVSGYDANVTATPSSGYRFINWTENDTEVSTATSYTFTATTNRTLQANFASNTVNITEATNTNATSLNNCTDCDITVTDATLTVNNAKSVKSITVEPGAKVIAGQPLTVSGTMKLKAGKTTAPGVKVDAAISVTGNLTLEKTLDNSKWYFISLPSAVAVADIVKVSGSGTLEYGVNWWIKYYDGASRTVNEGTESNWKTLTSGQTLDANKGYIIGLATSLTGDYVLSFPLNKTLISSAETARTVTVVNHGEALEIAANHKGWNLVGSPYLSSFTGSNVGANFLTFHNGTTYTQSANTSVSEIKAFSSFFVQASSGGTGANLSFDLAGRQAAPSVSPQTTNLIQLNLTSNGGSDTTTLILDESQTTDYTINEDLEKWLTTGTDVPQFFSSTGGIRYAFNALPADAVNVLALGIYTRQPVPATLALETSGNESQQDVWLLDKHTGKEVNLANESYSFTSQGSLETTRFEISLQRISTSSETLNQSGRVYTDAANLRLTINQLLPETTIIVYNVAGKVITSANTSDNHFSTLLPEKGIYQVQLINKGQSSVTKIVL